MISCAPPGVVIELYNRSPQDVFVRQIFNDGSTKSERVAPETRGAFGPALSWHVAMSGSVFELQHPGMEFASSRALGGQLFRFQAEAPGCLFVLLPEQRSPVTELPPQPRGYPMGATGTCVGPPRGP